MRIIEHFPRSVREIENVFVPLADGTRLAARIWLPEDALADPVPAILEYLPYRKRDGTVARDALTHPYFAGHGYASVRVDIRGSGDSEGVLKGEYLEQEQDDALEVIAWIAAQPWCTGRVGMIGISWGGFNGLQVAARQPPALGAVITIASTDDRYADDVHSMGGCILTDKLTWGATAFAIVTTPPDPLVVGEAWRDLWRQRLEENGLWLLDWFRHQRRDAFYEHGSIVEEASRITCPVYAVGGWADGYSNAVFRLLEALSVPRKGLVGPWGHKYPHFAKPGPAIGFLQECLRWWDQWLKDIDTGVMDEPMLRAFIEEPFPPRAFDEYRDGRWVAETAWPSPRIEQQPFALGPGGLGDPTAASLRVPTGPIVGLAAGKWCGSGAGADQSIDQRLEEGGQLIFESGPLEDDLEILGAPVSLLELEVDRPVAQLAATLCEVLDDGRATRLSYGILNLTHRTSHAQPTPLRPGERYRVRLQLNETGHRFAAGNRIRFALSSTYWPVVFPAPELARITIHSEGSRLLLPVRPGGPEDASLPPFPEPEAAPPLRQTTLEPGRQGWTVTRDCVAGRVAVERHGDLGRFRLDDLGLEVGAWSTERFTIDESDPASASGETIWRKRYARGDWQVECHSRVRVDCSLEHFRIRATLDAYEGETRIFTRMWDEKVGRDLV